MYGWQTIKTSCQNRRDLLKTRHAFLGTYSCRTIVLAVSACVLFPEAARTQGPARITLDEAIQMALRHNHTLLAARTTIPQSQAQEVTANLRPNPEFFADWEYLPIFSGPPGGVAAYL